MRSGWKVLLLVATLAIVGWPTPARADGFINPWVGVNFANETGDGRNAFGVSAGSIGRGMMSGELDFGYSPNFFGPNDAFGTNNVLDLMVNVTAGIPFGGRRGLRLRPYATGGVGVIRTVVKGPANVLDFTNNDIGFNIGVGAMGFMSDHVGIRGDVRYMRTVNADSKASDFDFPLGNFHYWRGSFGVVFQ